MQQLVDARDLLVRDLARYATARFIQQPGDAFLDEPAAALALIVLGRSAQARLDGSISRSLTPSDSWVAIQHGGGTPTAEWRSMPKRFEARLP
jgi:hypothetical protein